MEVPLTTEGEDCPDEKAPDNVVVLSMVGLESALLTAASRIKSILGFLFEGITSPPSK